MIERFKEGDFFHWENNQIETRLNNLLSCELSGIDYLELLAIDNYLSEEIKITTNLELRNKYSAQIKEKLGCHYSQMGIGDVHDLFKAIVADNQGRYYIETLVNWAGDVKLAKKVSDSEMKKSFADVIKVLIDARFFTSKYWVIKYPETMKNVYLSKPQNIEWILSNFTNAGKKYFFPDNITSYEYTNQFMEYVNSDAANLNWLQLVAEMPKGMSDVLDMIPTKRVLLKKRIGELNEEIMERGQTWTHNAAMFFKWDDYKKSQADKVYFDIKSFKQDATNPATVLNYINYLDGLWTSGRILNLASFPNIESSVFDSLIGIRSSRHYEVTPAVHIKLSLVLHQLEAMQHILREEGSSFEEVIEYFFESCGEENITHWLPLTLPKFYGFKNSSKVLFPAEENVRKQWMTLHEKGDVDDELLEFVNTPRFSEMPSLLEKKYFYPTDELNGVLKILYSDQSLINYINSELNGVNFVDLILKHSVNFSDFHEYQQMAVRKLKSLNLLNISDSGKVEFTTDHIMMLFLLREFWEYGVIDKKSTRTIGEMPFNFSEIYGSKLEQLEKQNLVYGESTLYSRPEQDYLDYLLNNSKFDNALGIRNDYGHDKNASIEEYKRDYYIAILVLLIDVVKINEEFHYRNIEFGGEGFLIEPDILDFI